MGMRERFGVGALTILSIPILFVTTVSSARFTSTSYIIDASVNNTFGGQDSSASYKVTTSGGEAIVGNGSGGSYKMGAGYVSQLDRGMQLTMQPSGLVAYYPLDETAGLRSYDSGTGNYSVDAATSPPRVAGKINGGLGPIPAGSTSYLQSTEVAAFNTSYVTACGWVNKSATATNPTIVSHGDNAMSTNGMWHLGYGSAQKMRFIIQLNGVSNLLTSTATVPLGSWHYFCGTYDGALMSLYIDGALDSTLALSGALPAVNIPLTIGARSGGAQTSDLQSLDEIKIYNRALSAGEVKAEYDAQNAGLQTGIDLGSVLPGASKTANADAIVQTDATSYSLGISQNHDLSNGGSTIPAVSGSISSPLTWSEGSTKGFGFTLYGANGSAIPAKWNSGASYAAVPVTSTTFYSRSGSAGAVKDYVNMRFRLDVAASQLAASYQNTVTVTGTMLP